MNAAELVIVERLSRVLEEVHAGATVLYAERDAAVEELADVREQLAELLKAGRRWYESRSEAICPCRNPSECAVCVLVALVYPPTEQEPTS